jgi:hypothetical protein
MNNTIAEENKSTVTEKIVKMPAEVGTAVVVGAETIGHDVVRGAEIIGQDAAKVIVQGATIVVDATKTAACDIAKAGEELGRDAEHIVSRTPEAPKPTTTVNATAPEA